MYSLTLSKMNANHVHPYFLKYEGQICIASVHNVDFVKNEADFVVCIYNVYLSKMKANMKTKFVQPVFIMLTLSKMRPILNSLCLFVKDEGQSCTALLSQR